MFSSQDINKKNESEDDQSLPLPAEMLLHILMWSDIHTWMAMRLVNKACQALVEDGNELWKKQVEMDFPLASHLYTYKNDILYYALYNDLQKIELYEQDVTKHDENALVSPRNLRELFNSIRKDDLQKIKTITVDTFSIWYAPNSLFYSAFYLAVHLHRREIVNYFMEMTPIVGMNEEIYSPIHMASADGSLERVKALLDMDPGLVNLVRRSVTPLCLAIDFNHLDVAKHLLENGADTKLIKPIFLMLRARSPELIDLLHQYHVDINVANSHGTTALMWHSNAGNLPVVKRLLELGAKTDLAAKECGNLPLHFTCRHGHLEVVQLLIEYGADVNAQSLNGNTALHIAVKYGHEELVAYLLENNADYTLETTDGKKPSDLVEYAISDPINHFFKLWMLLEKVQAYPSVKQIDAILSLPLDDDYKSTCGKLKSYFVHAFFSLNPLIQELQRLPTHDLQTLRECMERNKKNIDITKYDFIMKYILSEQVTLTHHLEAVALR